MNRGIVVGLAACALSLAACGGGGGDGGGGTPPPAGTFTIGGNVAGLAGSGLVLLNNGGNALAVNADGAFVFTTAIANGAAYAVTVQTQPSEPTQECVVTNGSGTVAGANVTNVAVACTTLSFRIAGTVSGLVGSGLELRDAAGTTIPVDADGPFEFQGVQPSGTPYFVSVASQPHTPNQFCSVRNGAGLVGGGDTVIEVLCNSGAAKFVYVPDFVGSGLWGIAVDGTGDLSGIAGSPFATGQSPASVAVTPADEFLYVRNNGSGTISGYAVDAATGALDALPGSPFAVTGQANTLRQMLLAPSGRFLYVLAADDVIHAFEVEQSGALEPVTGSPFAAEFATGWIGIDPLVRYLYGVSNTVGAYALSIDATTGALAAVGTPAAGATGIPRGVVHPSGALLYVAHEPDGVDAYTIDVATGQLQSAGSVLAASSQQTVPVIDPSGRFLYVPSASGGIAAFAIEAFTGVLNPIQGSPFLAGANVGQIDVDRMGRFLFAPLRAPANMVAVFTIDPTTGALQHATGSPHALSGGPTAVRVDAAGTSLFVATFVNDLVTKYTIGADGGLTLVDSEPAGTNAASLTLVGTQ